MVKRGARVPVMNVMRHLMVPNRQVESVISLLRERNLLVDGYRITQSNNGTARLIPVSFSNKDNFSPIFDDYELVEREGESDNRIDSDWWSHLADLIDQETIDEFGDSWPNAHEFIGDMMILRIEDAIKDYKEQIALAKLTAPPHIRLVLEDEGVFGEFRIRKLTPLGARANDKILTSNIPVELSHTRVVVKESGRHIICDPTRAYYSTKLQTERLETLAYAKELRKEIGEPLRVCDPFCGVGPALAYLIGEDGLIGDILAADLNPDAAEIMIENFSKWDRTEYEFTGELKRYSETRLLGVGDATRLSENENLIGNWNLILMNLPHRTIDFLPNIVPLLDRSKVSMIRGRVVVKESEIAEANASIVAALPPLLENKPLPELRIKRDYSASLRLCSFEAWIAPMD